MTRAGRGWIDLAPGESRTHPRIGVPESMPFWAFEWNQHFKYKHHHLKYKHQHLKYKRHHFKYKHNHLNTNIITLNTNVIILNTNVIILNTYRYRKHDMIQDTCLVLFVGHPVCAHIWHLSHFNTNSSVLIQNPLISDRTSIMFNAKSIWQREREPQRTSPSCVWQSGSCYKLLLKFADLKYLFSIEKCGHLNRNSQISHPSWRWYLEQVWRFCIKIGGFALKLMN